MSEVSIESRKRDHIEVAASGAADFKQKSTLLQCVHLAHQSLPELDLGDIDLSTKLLGKTLRAPIVVTGMTGGTPEARRINRDIACITDELGLAFGLGSQRALAEKPELIDTYQVRDIAPNALLIGNIGVVQAMHYGWEVVSELAKRVGANAMAVHLNPAQEMAQSGGDRSFRGALNTIASLVEKLSIPLIVKETGCGISAQAAKALYDRGVRTVDVAGAGGTSWVAVEQQRAPANSDQARFGSEFWDWGIPTAVSVHACKTQGMQVVASGGMRSGLDIGRALALGGTAGGMAAPILRAQRAGGKDAIRQTLTGYIEALTKLCLLTGSKTPRALSLAPKHIASPLRQWIDDAEFHSTGPNAGDD